MEGASAIPELTELNLKIADAENRGASQESRRFFDEVLAPAFAFRRASGDIVDRQGFLNALSSGGDRETEPDSLRVVPLGEARALVACVVRMTVGGERRQFHNARLFARDRQGQWRLLGWANEPQ